MEIWPSGVAVLERMVRASKSIIKILHIVLFPSWITTLIRSDFVEVHRFIAEFVAPEGVGAKWCYVTCATEATIYDVWVRYC